MEATASLRPMLAVAGTVADVRDGFVHEIKWDGGRVLVHLDGDGGVVLRSRSGADVTVTYPELADLADRVDAPAVLDGEVVVLDDRGIPSFGRLQSRFGIVDPGRARAASVAAPVQLVLFDVLVARGEVLLARGLEDRREVLASLDVAGGRVQIPPTSGDLTALLAVAEQRGDEGVVSKRSGSPYRPGVRSRDWIKLPFAERRDVVVGGWRPEKSSRGPGGVGRGTGPGGVGRGTGTGSARYWPARTTTTVRCATSAPWAAVWRGAPATRSGGSWRTRRRHRSPTTCRTPTRGSWSRRSSAPSDPGA